MTSADGPVPEEDVVHVRADGVGYDVCVPHWREDYIQGALVERGTPYEHELLRAMAARLGPGGLVLDVGANVGNHTLYLAAVLGAHVEAFEPHPELVEALRRSVERNGLEGRVTVHGTAVGRGAGTGSFATTSPSNLGAQSVRVHDGDDGPFPVVALDDLTFGQRVSCMKIDVEGMEVEVLEGARGILTRDQPVVYVEVGSEAALPAVVELLGSCGYCYWQTYNATPTHLFLPAATVTVDQKLQQILGLLAHDSYRAQDAVRTRRRLDAAARSAAAAETGVAAVRQQLRRQAASDPTDTTR